MTRIGIRIGEERGLGNDNDRDEDRDKDDERGSKDFEPRMDTNGREWEAGGDSGETMIGTKIGGYAG
ncbi:MAG: hypothetical protein ACOCVH_02895 [Verrucomicrobiota bacterium]